MNSAEEFVGELHILTEDLADLTDKLEEKIDDLQRLLARAAEQGRGTPGVSAASIGERVANDQD